MIFKSEKGMSDEELRAVLSDFTDECLREISERRLSSGGDVKGEIKVLILPPDFTRMYSGAGHITAVLSSIFSDITEKTGTEISIDVMPALGTHVPMSEKECRVFFEGTVDFDKLIVHNWRTDVVKLGEVPAEFVSEVSEGLVNEKIDVEVNRRIVSGEYDLILSVGQVVPHEVVGMANYSKNIFVGCGGSSMINSSHMLGAFYGMERIMGRDFSPVRKVFDYAERNFIADVPLKYILTVTTNTGDDVHIHGLYCGRERSNFEEAVSQSGQLNFIKLDKPLKKCVVNLDSREFKSTWLGNKAIYRTRLAMADGGDLIVLAPGVVQFGEDSENDRLIRKYGYVGRENVLRLVAENSDLKENLSVAAHLIHGSSDGRFRITYCTKKLTGEEVEGAGFSYCPYDDAAAKYNPEKLCDGWNRGSDGEEFYYISNPALGLWSV
ncbi:MAG: lactate racemase domain-containing protein [Clostridia bacterium]|nr:lactate racemase domain-containing protein [Clostridia bacterium]